VNDEEQGIYHHTDHRDVDGGGGHLCRSGNSAGLHYLTFYVCPEDDKGAILLLDAPYFHVGQTWELRNLRDEPGEERGGGRLCTRTEGRTG